jgi:UDP-N-acetylglucosamine--N-acetylmuramyl-(pentapeptide) pyrophosphoryl-undecaprenol N-acetylglucosamine transferase
VSYAIAAAGTGGHVYPGLAVGEALVYAGVPPADILYVGGNRLERTAYPAAGFPFFEVELRGLSRSLSVSNLGLPVVVARAVGAMTKEFRRRDVRVVLGMGGYVTVPAAVAAWRASATMMVAEQNAHAGLANRLAGRLAIRRFSAFADTEGLPGAEWVGNPVRSAIARFDRSALVGEARSRYGLIAGVPTLGVFGGSLGAKAINEAVVETFLGWDGPEICIVHLAGRDHRDDLAARAAAAGFTWTVVDFEDRMELFYAATDLVIARSGGAVAELMVTGSPAVLVPGGFGSAGHQDANARVLEKAGSAVVLEQDRLGELGEVVASILFDSAALERMRAAAIRLARPDAAEQIARAMMESHG